MHSRPIRAEHSTELHRRAVVQVGFSGLLSFGLPTLLAGRARAAKRAIPTPSQSPRSVILIFLTGAPSHQDLFDLKPDAPTEVRGEFKPIASRTPGLLICEHLPRLAACSDKYAIVRSMTHGLPSHEHATHMVLTGIDKMPVGATHMASRHDWPCFASGLDFVRPRHDGIPNGVMLPTYLNNGYGFSGQDAGVLGAKHDPWQIKHDPNAANFRVENLSLPVGLSVTDLNDRTRLLASLERQKSTLELSRPEVEFQGHQERAISTLTASRLNQAFLLDREPPRTRDAYGRHSFGQSLLLARRLVEAGVPIVQANMGTMNTWDTHNHNFQALKDRLLPPLDRGGLGLARRSGHPRAARRNPRGHGRRIWAHAEAGRECGHAELCPRRARSLGRCVLRPVRGCGRVRWPGHRPLRQDRSVSSFEWVFPIRPGCHDLLDTRY